MRRVEVTDQDHHRREHDRPSPVPVRSLDIPHRAPFKDRRIPGTCGASPSRRLSMRAGAVIIVIWLLLGLVAAFQRGYFKDTGDASCAKAGTVIVTTIAG